MIAFLNENKVFVMSAVLMVVLIATSLRLQGHQQMSAQTAIAPSVQSSTTNVSNVTFSQPQIHIDTRPSDPVASSAGVTAPSQTVAPVKPQPALASPARPKTRSREDDD